MQKSIIGIRSATFAALVSIVSIGSAAPVLAQPLVPPVTQTVSLSGPRFGLTLLPQGAVDKLKAEHGIEVGPNISQFGWQFEKQFYSKREGGVTAVTEFVVLAGGMDQGVVLPSLSWLVG